MLIVIPSLVILFAAIIIVYLVKSIGKRDEEREKRVINEEHLYKENNKNYYNQENRPSYRENEPEPECC